MVDTYTQIWLDENCRCCKYCDYLYPVSGYRRGQFYKAALAVAQHMLEYHRTICHDYNNGLAKHTRSFNEVEVESKRNVDLRILTKA